MPKTPNLGIEITTNTSTKFGDWWRSINSSDEGSFANIVDEFAGDTNNHLDEIDSFSDALKNDIDVLYDNIYEPVVEQGTPGQFLSKTDGGLEWKTVSSPSGGGSVIDVVLDSEHPNVTLVQNEFYNIQVDSDDEHVITFSSIGSSPTDYIEHKGQIHFNSSANVTFADDSIEWLGGLPTFKVGDVVEFSVVLGIGIAVSTNRRIETIFLHAIRVWATSSPIGTNMTYPEIAGLYLLSSASLVNKQPEEFTEELIKLIKTNTTGVAVYALNENGDEVNNAPISMSNGVLTNGELGTIIDINNMPISWSGVVVEDHQLDLNGNLVMSYDFLANQYENATDRFLTIPNTSYLQRWTLPLNGTTHVLMVDSPISVVGMEDQSTELEEYLYSGEWNGNIEIPCGDLPPVYIVKEEGTVLIKYTDGGTQQSVSLNSVAYIRIEELGRNANIAASVTYDNGIK